MEKLATLRSWRLYRFPLDVVIQIFPFAILEHAGQQHCPISHPSVAKVVYLVSLNAVDTFVQRLDPERFVSVYQQRGDLERTAIEIRSDKWFPGPMHELLQPTALFRSAPARTQRDPSGPLASASTPLNILGWVQPG